MIQRAFTQLVQGLTDWLARLARPSGLTFQGAADSEFLTGNAATVKRFKRDLWEEAVREIYFGKFMGKSQDFIIEEAEDLEGVPGDAMTFYLGRKLTGAGIADDADLETNEEAPDTYTDTVTLSQLRNAIRLKGKLSERRTAFSQRDRAKGLLKTWLAETIDDDIFTQFDSSPTTVIYGGNATATANIGSDDKFTLSLIDKAVAQAKKTTPKIWGAKVGAKRRYVCCIHTDIEYDLRRDAEYQELQREIGPRDEDNPIFSDMLGVYNNTVIHAHEKIPIATTWGSDSAQTGASNFFLGRQAGLFAWGSRPEWWEKSFDYANKTGFAIGATWDMTKAVFNSADHAFRSIRTFRTNN